jgi:hypothetical protein
MPISEEKEEKRSSTISTCGSTPTNSMTGWGGRVRSSVRTHEVSKSTWEFRGEMHDFSRDNDHE